MSKFTNAPEQRYTRVRKLIPSQLIPFLRGLRKRVIRPRQMSEPYYSIFPFTQVSRERQENLLRLAQDIEIRKLPGAIVECGVLDGGTAALMAYGTEGSARPVNLFDSWAGLPDSSDKDGNEGKVWAGECIGSPRRVAAIMQTLNISPMRVSFHKGWFADTFPKVDIQQIALLHIDADFYDSVRLCLEKWVPYVVPGGYVQIDDYEAFIGCRSAVDEFLALNPHITLESNGVYAKAYYFQLPTRKHISL